MAFYWRGPAAGLRHATCDHGPWHWITALALSAGQTLQFLALKSTAVSVVAVLGTLEVFFSAGLVMTCLSSTDRTAAPLPRRHDRHGGHRDTARKWSWRALKAS